MPNSEIYTSNLDKNKKYDPAKYLSEQWQNIYNPNLWLHIIIKDKNCGATYFAWKVLIKNCIDQGHKFFYIRNLLKQAKTFNAFNFIPEIVFGKGDDNNIYWQETNPVTKKIEKKHVGYCEGFTTIHNLQSRGIEDCKLLIWDEMIDIDYEERQVNLINRTIYKKFVSAISNVRRKNKVFQCYIFANRFTPNHELLFALGIQINDQDTNFNLQYIRNTKTGQAFGECMVLPPPKTKEAIEAMKGDGYEYDLASLSPELDAFYNVGMWGERVYKKIIQANHFIMHEAKKLLFAIDISDATSYKPITFYVFEMLNHHYLSKLPFNEKTIKILYIKEAALGDNIVCTKKPIAMEMGLWSEDNSHPDEDDMTDTIQILLEYKKIGCLFFDKIATSKYISNLINKFCCLEEQ